MLEIEMDSKKFKCSLKLNHKVSVFIGDSGSGKTWFVRNIFDPYIGPRVKYSENVSPVLLNSREFHNQLSGEYNGTPLFIVDDDDFVYTKEFGELFNKTGKCYLIMVVRTEVNVLPICADAIYKFKADGIKHYIEQV